MSRTMKGWLGLALLCLSALAHADRGAYDAARAMLQDADRSNDAQAAAAMLRAAEAGDLDAQAYMAFLYGRGVGVPQDPVAAGRWEARAVAQAKGDLGAAYAALTDGQATRADARQWVFERMLEEELKRIEQAVATVKRLSPQLDAVNAQLEAAIARQSVADMERLMAQSTAISAELQSAVEVLRRAQAEQEKWSQPQSAQVVARPVPASPPAPPPAPAPAPVPMKAPPPVVDDGAYDRALALIEDGSPGEVAQGAAAMLRAAEAGDIDAQAYMVYLYAEGVGVVRDPAAAARWEARASARPEADDQMREAFRMLRGEGVARDPSMAAMQLNVVANARAFDRSLASGRPVAPPPPPPSPAPAPQAKATIASLHARAMAGQQDAMVELAGRYRDRDGVPASPVLCLFWAGMAPADLKGEWLADACDDTLPPAALPHVALARERLRRRPPLPAWPADKDSAIRDFLAGLNEEERSAFRTTSRPQLRDAHRIGWGLVVFNRYGLAVGNTGLMRSVCGDACVSDANEAVSQLIEAAWDASWRASAKGFGAAAATAPVAVDTPERRKALEKPVDVFLRRLDAGGAAATWADASPLLRAGRDSRAWAARIADARAGLRGPVRSRTIIDHAFSSALRNQPPGEYATVDLETDFAGRVSDERVTLHYHDGQWKVIDYVAAPHGP